MGRQHLGAAHDQAVGRLVDDAEVNKGIVLLMRTLRAVALRIDDGMGEEQIAVAAIVVIVPDVLRELLAALTEEVGAFGPGHQHRVEIIGRAADHAEGGVGPDFHGLAALDEIGVGARDHERAAGEPAVAGIGHDLAVLRLRLQIVELRDRLNGPPKDRIGCDVADAPARDPNLSRRPAQAFDEFFSVSRCHQQLPLLSGRLVRLICPISPHAKIAPGLLSIMRSQEPPPSAGRLLCDGRHKTRMRRRPSSAPRRNA